ncbi:MAG: energy-coupling factor transporter transmembrane component T [Clostridiales bacterium]
MKSAFAGYHPVINFLYFTFVFICSMFFMHPICLAISIISGVTYSIVLNGKKALRFNLIYLLPMMLIAMLVNPAFNHEGATILVYLSSGNPITLESIAFGIAAAVMLAAVVSWFSCYNVIMTSDKFIYLFGRVIPALSLILSMVLRFIPKFKAQIKVISNAQKCVGRDVSNGSILQRAKHGIKILSIMVTWSLENAIETADSMKTRGYGLPGRTAFSIYRFDKRDKKALLVIGSMGLYVIIGAIVGGVYFRYFPSMKSVSLSPFSVTVFAAYFILCIYPIIIERQEDRKWKQLKSKI